MNHSFDVDIAIKYGVNAAILLQNIYWWVSKNKANNRHFYDGCYWTYNSRTAFTELFPYLSERQIKTAMDKLIADGVIKTGDYNTDKWKRPTWYALTEKGWSLLQNGATDGTEMSDRRNENVSSYTDISTDDIKNINISSKGTKDENDDGFDEFWKAYPRHDDKKTARIAWAKLKPDESLRKRIADDIQRRKKGEWKDRERRYILLPSTYIHKQRWEDEPYVEDDEPIVRDLNVAEIMERCMGN